MSKIFDALKKAGVQEDVLVDPMLDDSVSEERGGAAVAVAQPVAAQAATHVTAPAAAESDTTRVEGPSPAATAATAVDNGPRIARLQVSALSPVFPFEDLHSQAAEQYRMIRTKILHHPLQPRTIVVTSASSGDGKTVTAINLAAVLALKKDVRVLLVDADLRRRDVHKVLGIPDKPGLTDVLSNSSRLEDGLVQLEQFPNLWVLPAGSGERNPAELLESRRWRDLMADCRGRFTHVVIDATPIAAVTDFDLVQMACDGVVLVVRPDHTNRRACLKALEIVPKDKLVGTILNCVEDWFLWKPQGYGYYYSSKS